ncbi:MAG TPA: ATP-binding cassette domain-containing protein [Bryobacteraceae bacterium]|jgi:phospholipid/cholesterol/gamma-HCH transport system ATP-binding protein
MDAGTPVVRFEDVSLHFGDTPALVHVSFEMRAGETRVLFGAAGSGKTQLLKVALGLVKPDSGRVYLFGQEITHLKERDLFDIRARVGILFQEGGLFDSLNIADNVAYPLLNQPALQRSGTPAGNGHAAPAPAMSVDDRVREALTFVELQQTVDKFPSELSGGMRRRVGIARALVTEPALLLYDSPTAGLDPITANTIIALLLKEREMRNTATIMVTHRYLDGHLMGHFRYNPSSGKMERASAEGSSSVKIFVMQEGRLAFEGTEAELETTQDPYIKKFLRHGSA